MRWINVRIGPVAARVAPLQGTVAECPDCGRREWFAFRLGDTKRVYLQCCKCDRVETADGLPSAELSLYALAESVDDNVIHPLTMPGKEAKP